MLQRYFLAPLLPLLGLAASTRAQAPTVTRASLAPAANARTAPVGTSVGVTFSQPIDPATAGNVRVFSAQYRGQRAATAAVSGSTVTLTPTVPANGLQQAAFRPGEVVSVSVLATVQSTAGVAAVPYVYQFTTAVSRAGGGIFSSDNSADIAVGREPTTVALGDLDSDGDLDLLVVNSGSNIVSVRLNDGSGTFTSASTSTSSGDFAGFGGRPYGVALGDMDGDGDLDALVTAQGNSGMLNRVILRFNDGSGVFNRANIFDVGSNPRNVVVGDVDGDGDLDILTANLNSGTVSVRLNDGSGNFSGTQEVAVGIRPISLTVGDLDGDGDLDLVTTNQETGGSLAGTVSVRLNDGSGVFGGGSNPAVGTYASGVAVGDLDGDGDLDLLASHASSGTVSVRLNNGSGVFGGGSEASTPDGSLSVVVGDLDGDGDLDLVTPGDVCLNDGSGVFGISSPQDGGTDLSVALGDLDGDGDLDYVSPEFGSNTVLVRFNQPSAPLPVELAAFAAQAAGPAAVQLTWTTASEAGSAYFAVERSSDGAAWQELGRVPAAGSSASARHYAYRDGTAPASQLYYRLRLVDADGSTRYSPVRALSFAAPATVSAYPVPARPGQALTVAGLLAGASVAVLDTLGRVVATTPADATGTALLALPAGLTSGVYVVRTSTKALRLTVE